jgi:hypothetical protein
MANEKQLNGLAKVSEPAPLLEEKGFGAISAAKCLTAWSHAGRVRSEAAFASLAGMNPIPACAETREYVENDALKVVRTRKSAAASNATWLAASIGRSAPHPKRQRGLTDIEEFAGPTPHPKAPHPSAASPRSRVSAASYDSVNSVSTSNSSLCASARNTG